MMVRKPERKVDIPSIRNTKARNTKAQQLSAKD